MAEQLTVFPIEAELQRIRKIEVEMIRANSQLSARSEGKDKLLKRLRAEYTTATGLDSEPVFDEIVLMAQGLGLCLRALEQMLSPLPSEDSIEAPDLMDQGSEKITRAQTSRHLRWEQIQANVIARLDDGTVAPPSGAYAGPTPLK